MTAVAVVTPHIPVVDLAADNRLLRPELVAALERVVDSGRFVSGAEVDAFEAALAGYVGAAQADASVRAPGR